MKTILLILFLALNLNAQKKSKEEYYNTGPNLDSLKRMYNAYVSDPFKKPQSLKYLSFNFYAYNELQKVIEPKEKAQLFAYLETNYFRELCIAGNAKNKRLKIDRSDVNCSTFAIRISNYADKYIPKYNDDKRSKINPPVEFDFKNDTYTIKKETYSVKTGASVHQSHKKSESKSATKVQSNQ